MTFAGPVTVLLLHPPITIDRGEAEHFGLYPPLGLAYLAAELERCDIAVAVADLQLPGTLTPTGAGLCRLGRSDADIEALLVRLAPKVVGIGNNFTSFSDDALALARLVRRVLPEALVVMGGAQATVSAHALVVDPAVDTVVLGEGEYTLRDLVRLELAGNRAEAVGLPGTVWDTPEGVRDNGYPGPIPDLDALPLPAYHLLDMQAYIWQKQANFSVSRRWPVAHMITTRGCLYNCLFCSTSRLFKKFRSRSPRAVVAEMRLLIERYGIREFHFHDDSFLSDPKRVRELCELFLAERLDVLWQVSQGINSVRLTEELLALMCRAGMYRVGFPIESGDEDTLRFVRKPVNLEKVKRLVAACNALGIYTFGCFMIGFPRETREQIEHTIAFMEHSGLDYAKVSIVQPLEGSQLYGEFQQLGLVGETPRHGSTYWRTAYDTLHLTAAELNVLRAKAVSRFNRRRLLRFLTPAGVRRYLLPKLRSLEDVRYFLRLAWLSVKGV